MSSGSKFHSFETIESPRLFNPLKEFTDNTGDIERKGSSFNLPNPLILKDTYKFGDLKRDVSESESDKNQFSDYTTDGSLTYY